MQLTPPGQVYHADFRNEGNLGGHNVKNHISLCQFNIERGYKLEGIIKALREQDADVLCLQEVDVGCERSGGLDTGAEIARALELNYVFLSEFVEIKSPARSSDLQGGGVHGNAILTKFNIIDVDVVRHSHHPVDWNDPSHVFSKKEPRQGERAVLRATLDTTHGPLVVYCAHFEVFCGMLARIMQLQDIFADSIRMIHQGFHHQAILGDLNTMAHGIARLSPHYCRDSMRWLTLGTEEGVIWEKHVLQPQHPMFGSVDSEEDMESEDYSDATSGIVHVNEKLISWGLPPEHANLNPGFKCPFPADSTVTLDNPSYRFFNVSFMKGKLDWALLRKLTPIQTSLGNMDFSLSDHRWLSIDVVFSSPQGRTD